MYIILSEPCRNKMMAAMQDVQTTQPNTHNDILDPNTKTIIKVCKMKRGDDEIFQPKVIAAGTDKEFQIFLRLPALPVLYSDTSPNGDQEKFNKSPEQAVNSFTLTKGNKFSNVKRGMPNLENDQQEAFDMIEQMHKDLLIAAFNSDDVKCSGKTKAKAKAVKILKNNSLNEMKEKIRNKNAGMSEADVSKKAKEAVKKIKHSQEEITATALHVYLEDSHDSGMKEVTYTDNGEEKTEMSLKIKRKVRGFRQVEEEIDGELVKKRKLVPTPPVFHKPTPTAEYYEKKYGNYVPRGTLLMFRVRRSFFSSPMMYGTNLTFDKDVVILCESKKRERSQTSKPVEFFEDQDDEQDYKRARTDE